MAGPDTFLGLIDDDLPWPVEDLVVY